MANLRATGGLNDGIPDPKSHEWVLWGLEWHGIHFRKVDILSAVQESRIDLDGQHAHPTYKDTMLLIVNPGPSWMRMANRPPSGGSPKAKKAEERKAKAGTTAKKELGIGSATTSWIPL